MALGTPSESPAVVVREIDLTGGVPNVQSSTGAIVGNYIWGPGSERTLISNEAELVDTFGSPNTTNNIDFLSATQFLRYSGSLIVVREMDDSTYNAAITTSSANIQIKNLAEWDAEKSGLSDSNWAIAKYPGELGNSLSVSICTSTAGDSDFDNWAYKEQFDGAPGTSFFVSQRGGSRDEAHIAVVDRLGDFTGTPGSVLETFPFISVALNAEKVDGRSNYALDVINSSSEYVRMKTFPAEMTDAGTEITSGGVYNDSAGVIAVNFSNGRNSGALGTTQYLNGYDLFEDKDQVEVDFIISPSMAGRADQTTVVNDLTSTARTLRKDCVAVASPARSDIIDVTSDATKVTNTVTTANTFTNTSYLIMDNNFLKVYDKYNDQYVFIPAASTVAGVMAATDINRAAWFSPAGSRRGQILGITALAYSPTKAQRDTLYKASVNPIANIPGQGALLFGDKTMYGRPSAFNRINVRRLFLILERAIGKAAEQVMFEFNDEFTRAEFVNIVEPVLREVQGRRGITDFRVVCDETNNTPAVIDRNEFKADIFIKPARSINYVTLSFVAVRTGVDFEEVVGTV